jgi:hypothetical protein
MSSFSSDQKDKLVNVLFHARKRTTSEFGIESEYTYVNAMSELFYSRRDGRICIGEFDSEKFRREPSGGEPVFKEAAKVICHAEPMNWRAMRTSYMLHAKDRSNGLGGQEVSLETYSWVLAGYKYLIFNRPEREVPGSNVYWYFTSVKMRIHPV